MKSMFKYYLNTCSIWPDNGRHSAACTTASRRRRHYFADALVQERLAEFLPRLYSLQVYNSTARRVHQLKRNFNSGRSAAGHHTQRNQPDLSPELAATCLAQRTKVSRCM